MAVASVLRLKAVRRAIADEAILDALSFLHGTRCQLVMVRALKLGLGLVLEMPGVE